MLKRLPFVSIALIYVVLILAMQQVAFGQKEPAPASRSPHPAIRFERMKPHLLSSDPAQLIALTGLLDSRASLSIDVKVNIETDPSETPALSVVSLVAMTADGMVTLDQTQLTGIGTAWSATLGDVSERDAAYEYRVYATSNALGARVTNGWIRLRLLPPSAAPDSDTAAGGAGQGADGSPGADGSLEQPLPETDPLVVNTLSSSALVVRAPESTEPTLSVDTAQESMVARLRKFELRQVDDLDGTFLRFQVAENNYGSFNFSFARAANAGSPRDNRALTWGYNQTPDAGYNEIPGEPALAWRIESFYAPEPGREYMEAHLQYVNHNGELFRPLGYRIDRNSDAIDVAHTQDYFALLDRETNEQYFGARRGLVALFDTSMCCFTPGLPYIRQINSANDTMVPLLHLGLDDAVTLGIGEYPTRLVSNQIGFFGAPPASQPADIGSLLDQTGGTKNGTLAPVTDPAAADNFAELNAKIESLREALIQVGLMDNAGKVADAPREKPINPHATKPAQGSRAGR